MRPPEVSYARSGDVAIAYQIVGTGPPDLVFVRGTTGATSKASPNRLAC